MDYVQQMNALDRRRVKQRTPAEVQDTAAKRFGQWLLYSAVSLVMWFAFGALLGLIAPEEHSASGNRGSHLSDGRPDVTMQHTVSDTAAETAHLLLTRPARRVM